MYKRQGVYGLLGANGAGKTTLMRMICDVQTETKGAIMFNGQNLSLIHIFKAEKKQTEPEKKLSIRAQLKAAKEQTPKKQARQKTQDLERS